MDNNYIEQKKPAKLKVLAWGLFSLTATLTAIFLPGLIIRFISDYPESVSYFWIITFSMIIISTLYVGIYRNLASNKDLFLVKKTIYIFVFFIILYFAFLIIENL